MDKGSTRKAKLSLKETEIQLIDVEAAWLENQIEQMTTTSGLLQGNGTGDVICWLLRDMKITTSQSLNF